MIDTSSEELQEMLKQLDLAVYWHEKWFADLSRAVICQLPHDTRDISEDAHRQCRFGQWYYGNANQQLHNHPSLVAIECAHIRMHQLAGTFLVSSTQGETGSPLKYDNLRGAVDQLRLEIGTLKHEIERSLYNRDALTGAENRIGMLTTLRELHELAKRSIQECALVVMDVDHFKSINDTFGHSLGDRVLVALVQHLKLHLRPYDRVYRYGGEEFLISLPGASIQTAQAIIERMRAGIAALVPEAAAPRTIAVTASFGIAELDASVSVEDSINRADTALYSAKKQGRNRSCVWEPSMIPKQDGSP